MEEKSISSIFADNIVFYRKKLGYSQYDLAMMTGISRGMIGHCEREGMIPAAERLQALADTFGVDVYKLFKKRHSDNKEPGADYLSDIDPRSIKKFRDILSLPVDDRNDIYRILNKMLRKNQLERNAKGS